MPSNEAGSRRSRSRRRSRRRSRSRRLAGKEVAKQEAEGGTAYYGRRHGKQPTS